MRTVSRRISRIDRYSKLYRDRNFHEILRLSTIAGEHRLLEELELGFFFGGALVSIGEFQRALQWLPTFKGECVRKGNTRLLDRSLNVEAVAYIELGRLYEAEDILRDLHSRTSHEDSPQLWAGICNNLGVIASIRCQWGEALLYFGKALAFVNQLGDNTQYAIFQHNLGMTYRELGFLDAAGSHFDSALAYALEKGFEREITYIGFERALLSALSGDTTLAESAVDRAFHRAQASGDRQLIGEVLRVAGTIAIRTGRWDLAESSLSAALEVATQTGFRLLEAETSEQLALLHMRLGDPDESQRYAREARSIYLGMGAGARVSRMTGMLGYQNID